MTDADGTQDRDLIGLSVTGALAHFPGLAIERTVALGALDPERVSALLAAADAAAFFTRAEPRDRPVRPDARTWLLRLSHAGRSRLLALSKPLSDPRDATLVRLARGCLSARRMIGFDEGKRALRSANILDALDMPGAEDIEINLDRPVSYPRPAAFD